MDKFNLYAQYYDLLYHDKNYNDEVDYIEKLITSHSSKKNTSILDLGCGTGKHANLLSLKGYTVDGVDISSQMIGLAKSKYGENNKVRFFEGDISSFQSHKKYDIVTSLFHVMSYQNTNNQVLKALQTSASHLEKEGLLIFDFWYGPGVLTDRPEARTKILEDEKTLVERKAKPVLHVNDNIVDVNYDITITNKHSQTQQQIFEKHSMRYFFMNELTYYLKTVGFEMLNYFEWMTHDLPNTKSWNVVIVAIKI